jgi:hypothetical protein
MTKQDGGFQQVNRTSLKIIMYKKLFYIVVDNIIDDALSMVTNKDYVDTKIGLIKLVPQNEC